MVHSTNIYKLHLPIKNSHVLVVDDDTTTRTIIRRVLENAGYMVTDTSTGEEALQQIEASGISLILLDIIMPGTDGMETLIRIRQKYSMSELPIIMVTIKGEDNDITTALSLGANDYIIKPINIAVLRARLESHLSHKHLQDNLRKANSELERRVEQRTKRLSELNEQLKDEIASRKEAEEELTESYRYFESLIENVNDIIAVIQKDGVILYESPSVEKILGYQPEQRIGRNTFDLIHPEDRSSAMDLFGKAFLSPGTMYTIVARFLHQDGSWRTLETNGHTAWFHGQLHGIVNARDITGRPHADT